MTTTNKEKTDWIINTELFKNESNPFDSEEKRRDRKFNLKIRSSDLELIDCLASEYQISRSVLINYLLNKGLIRDLLPNESSDGHSDLDVKVLIAHRADQKLEKTSFYRESTWVEDIFFSNTQKEANAVLNAENEFAEIYDVPSEMRHGADFNALNNFFKKLEEK